MADLDAAEELAYRVISLMRGLAGKPIKEGAEELAHTLRAALEDARAASAGQGALRERIERIAEQFENNAEHAEWRVKEYARDCPADPARHVAEGRARTWRFCAAVLNEELGGGPLSERHSGRGH